MSGGPSWKAGDPIPSPVDAMIQLDPAVIGAPAAYKILIGGIVPRPIAFVSTRSPEGLGNLAPFSFFNGVSSDPPCVMISITRKPDGGKKDTLRNIEATGQFVVNTVSDWMAGPMNQCSGDYPYGVDEMTKVGLTPVPSARVAPARVKESPIHFECELYKSLEIGAGGLGSATLIVGRVVMMHVHTPAYDGGRIKLDQIRPLARLGGHAYGLTSGVFDLPRPKI